VLLCACGSNTGTGGETRSCSLTLGGAVTGSFDCRPATTFFNIATDTTGFAFSVQQRSDTPGVTVAVGVPGSPQSRTYRSTDANASGGLEVTTATGNGRWSAVIADGGATGSYTMIFSSVTCQTNCSPDGGPGDAGTAVPYTASGTLDATLPQAADGGIPGNVTLHVTF
jgi:hypothetical protein